MGIKTSRDENTFRIVLQNIQKVRSNAFSLFDEEGEERSFTERYDIAVFDLDDEASLDQWRDLHNDPDVEIVSERDMSNPRIGLRTVVRFVRRKRDLDETALRGDPVFEDLWD